MTRSATFLQLARELYPPGGSAAGQPSFDLFETGPLAAFEELASRAFEELAEPAAGIRCWTTISVPLFPPMTFFCLLTTDDVVEVIDVAVDEDYDWGVPED